MCGQKKYLLILHPPQPPPFLLGGGTFLTRIFAPTLLGSSLLAKRLYLG
jgi:hypothetical protein